MSIPDEKLALSGAYDSKALWCMARNACGLWLLFVLTMSLLEFYSTSDFLLFEFHFPSALVTLRRTEEILLPSLLFLIAPVAMYAVFGPLVTIFRKNENIPHWAWRELAALGLRLGLISFSAMAVLWGVLGAMRAIEGQNPWDALPFVSPTQLDDFLNDNPGFSAIGTLGSEPVLIHDGKGRFAWIDSGCLQHAIVAFMPCSDPIPPEALGGLPPYPGSRCEFMIQIRRQGVEDNSYLFSVDGSIGIDDLNHHFERWADSIGAESTFFGYGNYFFEAQQDERRWNLWIRYGKHIRSEIYIHQGGYAPPPS